jgi:hypothetical protein
MSGDVPSGDRRPSWLTIALLVGVLLIAFVPGLSELFDLQTIAPLDMAVVAMTACLSSPRPPRDYGPNGCGLGSLGTSYSSSSKASSDFGSLSKPTRRPEQLLQCSPVGLSHFPWQYVLPLARFKLDEAAYSRDCFYELAQEWVANAENRGPEGNRAQRVILILPVVPKTTVCGAPSWVSR